VFARLAHPYTRGLFAARPRLGLARGTRLATIAGRVPELPICPPAALRRTLRMGDRRLPRRPAAGAIGPSHRGALPAPG
jgi:peptide/nickel transport system ATP-binding protein